MFTILMKIQKNLAIAIPVVMILGLVTGALTDTAALKQWILPATFVMVYPMMVTMAFDRLRQRGDTKLQSTTQLINFLLIPAIAYGIGLLFFPEQPYYRLGFLLVSLLPTSGMTISWTGMSKGNMEAAVKMTVIGLILGSLLTPVYIQVLMGTSVSVPFSSILVQILTVVALPLLLGLITQKLLVKKYGKETFMKTIKKKFPPVSTVGVLFIVFIAMALKSRGIISNPQLLLRLVLPLILLYIINFIISTLIAKSFFNRADGLALVYGSVLRNLSIALAIAMTSFGSEGSDIALIVALGYIIQIQGSSWYVKLSSKIFPVRETAGPLHAVQGEA